nr:hypothetical protein [Tanacetum cinerariifolium]
MGYPIPTGSTSNFSRPFLTGEYSNHQNHKGLVSTEGVFQKNLDFSLGSTGGMFTGPIRTTSLPNHGPDRGWGSGTDYRMRKLKMPLFNRDDVYDWVYQAERFFDIRGLVTTGERLRAVMMCLEGPALSWSRWSATKEPFRTWEELKSRMLSRFQSSQAGSLHEQFFSISQNGTARDYVTVFEKMAAQLPGLQEKVQEGIFIKGLKPDLRVAVRTQKLTGVRQAMELALLIDEGGKGGAAKQPNKVGGGVLRTSIGATRVGTSKAPFKRMTEAEMADKRAKGLCYRCDEKYGPGHRCPVRALQGEENAHLDMVEVSAQSVVGLTSPHTMKLRGNINGFGVVVLIDSGATHNFLSVKLVGPLNVMVTGTRQTGVVLGNGKSETSVGMCHGLKLKLPGLVVIDDFYPLELGSTDVILGMKWLRQLDDTRINWKKLTMTFQHEGEQVTLHGEAELHRGAASLRALARGLDDIVEGYMVSLADLGGLEMPESQVHPDLDALLTDFSDVFSMPAGLPPLGIMSTRLS